jgi:hypothetical protein
MTKFYAKKKDVMIVEKLETQTQVRNKFSPSGVVTGEAGDFVVYNESDPSHLWLVDNNYIDEHYEIIGMVEADGLQESPDAIEEFPPPQTGITHEEPGLPPEDAPEQPEPDDDPEA